MEEAELGKAPDARTPARERKRNGTAMERRRFRQGKTRSFGPASGGNPVWVDERTKFVMFSS